MTSEHFPNGYYIIFKVILTKNKYSKIFIIEPYLVFRVRKQSLLLGFCELKIVIITGIMFFK